MTRPAPVVAVRLTRDARLLGGDGDDLDAELLHHRIESTRSNGIAGAVARRSDASRRVPADIARSHCDRTRFHECRGT